MFLLTPNIKTLGELIDTPASKLLGMKNFGKKSLAEINEILEGLGLPALK